MEEIFDLNSFRLPGEEKIYTLHPAIPRNTKEIPFDIFDYKMLFNDQKVKALIREAKTIGCFYIESPAMRSLLAKLQVDTFEMLTAASSIIRPGVAEAGMMQEFIARHFDPSRRKYLVPQMKEVLGETYGVMVYQEDVVRVIHQVVGLSLEEADLLRRAMSGKMRSHAAMQALADKFLNSCLKKGFTISIARELWRQVESFAGYSFCKAHSASFAILSFQVAYLKAYYPAEFMAAVLSNQGGFYSAAVYIQECKRMGIKILLPCINQSSYEYRGKKDWIRIGFMAIKSFSRNSAEVILNERKSSGSFNSLADFLIRTKIKYEESALLIKSGAMDCFNETRPTLLRMLTIYIRRIKIFNTGYNDLFMDESFELLEAVKTDKDYSLEEKCLMEYKSFDYMVTRHPLDFYPHITEKPGVVKASEMNNYKGKNIVMAGWYMTSKRIKTKKGDVMKFLSLEDLTGTFETVIFPKTYYRVAEKTLSMGPYIVKGKVDDNNLIVNDLQLAAENHIKASLQWDSTEYVYKPDDEGLSEGELYSLDPADIEKIKRAYVANY